MSHGDSTPDRRPQAQAGGAVPAPLSSSEDGAGAFLSLAAQFIDNERLKIEAEERVDARELELATTVEHHSYRVTQMAFTAGAVLVALSFALIWTGHEPIGIEVLKLTVTAGLGIMAGYGWGKKKMDG